MTTATNAQANTIKALIGRRTDATANAWGGYDFKAWNGSGNVVRLAFDDNHVSIYLEGSGHSPTGEFATFVNMPAALIAGVLADLLES